MYTDSFHSAIEKEETPQANRLADYIAAHLKPKRCLDFGCSSGIYLRAIKQKMPSVPSAGFEFSHEAILRRVCDDVIQVDLTVPLDATVWGKTAATTPTLGICLEVLEHISDDSWRPVLENITRLSDVILFSAAVPGQGGTGHINCRPKLDWIRRFHGLGWVVDYDATRHMQRVMTAGYHMGWFANNAIILVPASVA